MFLAGWLPLELFCFYEVSIINKCSAKIETQITLLA